MAIDGTSIYVYSFRYHTLCFDTFCVGIKTLATSTLTTHKKGWNLVVTDYGDVMKYSLAVDLVEV